LKIKQKHTFMEEILTLKELLQQGKVKDALIIVKES
jgi:hypothetical protein